MKKKYLLTLLALAFLSINNIAQEATKTFSPTIKWKGFSHIWAGSGQQDALDAHYGFSVRYLRFKAYGKLTPRVKWAAQYAFDKGNPGLLDVHLTYEPAEYLKIRVGQFPVPGAKSGVLSSSIWSTTKMIFIDRPTITQNWASNAGLKGFRSGGAMLYGSMLDKKLKYYLMAAMPLAGSDNYFTPSLKKATYSHDEDGTALYSRLEFSPIKNMELGTNFHVSKSIDTDTTSNNKNSYGFYLLTRQDKLYVMAEYMAGTNKRLIHNTENSKISYNGFFFELAYKLKNKYEPAIRYDAYTPVKNGMDKEGVKQYNNLTIGVNYYPKKNIAIMGNYVLRDEDTEIGYKAINNNLFYVQLRFLFAAK